MALVGYEANIKNRVGSNQYAFELLKAIHRLDRRNKYVVYLPGPPLADLPKERTGWQYRVIGPPRLWNILGLPGALYQQRPKPEVVFNPGHYSPLFFPAPLVISIMDLGYLHFPGQFTKPILFKLKFWTALSIRRARHIFAISESTKNDIMKYYGVASDKITTTYLGYDKSEFHHRLAEAKIAKVRKKYKISGDYILFLGTLKPNKNIEGLLKAFKLLDDSQLRLVIAGRKGWLFKSIFNEVKQLGLEKRVIFTDFVEEEDVSALMTGAEVFAQPSFWEGFGIPVVEAMACGTPVVVSDAGSLPEIAGEAGIVVNPNKPEDIARGIKGALKNRESLVKKGLVQVKKFDWEECAKQTIRVLERIR